MARVKKSSSKTNEKLLNTFSKESIDIDKRLDSIKELYLTGKYGLFLVELKNFIDLCYSGSIISLIGYNAINSMLDDTMSNLIENIRSKLNG